MHANLRQQIGETITGDVLEIGPGSNPFPTAPGAKLKYADRSVEGGRDANWPELIGSPPGVNADFNINLDVDGLNLIADGSFDAVIASHVIEHLANPIKAIREFERVLRPSGKLVLIVPDRTLTFDSVRFPTEFSHLLNEFHDGVTDVSDAHILEFCEAIYGQSPIHPDVVREWHNPAKLDDALLALHRRRSIHVHCWLPEEFASLIAGLLANGLISFKFCDLSFADDYTSSNEFSLVFERSSTFDTPKNLCLQFINSWVTAVLSCPQRDAHRVVKFQQAIYQDLSTIDDLREIISSISTILTDHINMQAIIINKLKNFINAMEQSPSWRITAPLRKAMAAVRQIC